MTDDVEELLAAARRVKSGQILAERFWQRYCAPERIIAMCAELERLRGDISSLKLRAMKQAAHWSAQHDRSEAVARIAELEQQVEHLHIARVKRMDALEAAERRCLELEEAIRFNQEVTDRRRLELEQLLRDLHDGDHIYGNDSEQILIRVEAAIASAADIASAEKENAGTRPASSDESSR